MLNILLVDDEMSVLDGLKHILDKRCPQYTIVGMAQSAREALDVASSLKVDVVVTDVRMPGMDGIELTERLLARDPGLHVVILSGHADFEYVRQALRRGAYDYLLKPCHYQTILELFSKIEENVREKGKRSERDLYAQTLELAIRGKSEETERTFDSTPTLAMAVLATKDDLDATIHPYLRTQLEKWNIDAAQVDTLAVEERLVVLFRRVDDDRSVHGIKQRLYELRHALGKQGHTAYIAVHEFPRRPRALAAAYDACKQVLDFLTFNELPAVMDSVAHAARMEEQRPVAMSEYFSGKTVGRYFLQGDHKRLREYIECNVKKMHQLDVYLEPSRVKKELLAELAYLEHELKEQRVEPSGGTRDNYIEKINGFRTFRELLGWLKQHMLSLCMCMNDDDQVPHYIQAAIRFIDRHYMEDLTLKAVSDAVYLNHWYFSSQFKKYTGLTFSEYLNQVRIRMAKEFLKQKDLKVYQVAEMVGFQDAAYFSTVFKNMEHMSPKDYQRAF